MRKSTWLQSILIVFISLAVPMVGNASVLGFSVEAGLDFRQLMPDISVVDGFILSHQDVTVDDQNKPVEPLILNEGSCLSCGSADYLKTDRATFYGYALSALPGDLPYEVGWRSVAV